MTFLNGRERRHDACRDGRRDDTERRNGKEDEECDETSYLVHDGVGHNQTLPHHEPAHHIRHLHDGYERDPRPEPCRRSHSRQNLCEADDSKGEVRDAVELGAELGRLVGLEKILRGIASECFYTEHFKQGQTERMLALIEKSYVIVNA